MNRQETLRQFSSADEPREQKNISGLLNSVLFLALTAILGLLLAAVPLKVAMISVLILVIQIFAGGSFLTLFTKKTQLSWQEFCGAGIAIGTLLTFGLDQIFRNTAISSFAWLAPILFLPFAISRQKIKFDATLVKNSSFLVEMLPIFAAVFLMLSAEWFWTLPVALFLIAVVIWREFPKWRRYSSLMAIALIPVSLLSINIRPVGWWIEDTDVALYEAISRTLGTWGFRDNINAVGTSTNYHWFAYAWSGLVDRVSGSPEWVSNTRTIPLLTALGTVLIIWAILERLSHNRIVIIFSLFAISGFDSVQTWGRGFKIGLIPSPSQMYGLLLLLTFVFVFILHQNRNLKNELILFFLIGFGVVGAKVAHGVILAGSLGFAWFVTFIQTRSLKISRTWVTFATLASIASSFYLIIGGGGGSSRGMFLDQFAFVDGISGDFKPYGLGIHWISGIIFLFGFLGLQLVGLVVFCVSPLHPQYKPLKLFAIGTAITGVISAMFLSGEFAVELFFTHAASSVLLVLVVPIAINLLLDNKHLQFSPLILGLALVTGLLAAVVAGLMPNLDSGSTSAIALRTIPSLVGLVPIFFAIAITAINKRKNSSNRQQFNWFNSATSLALVGLFAMSIGFFSINYAKNIRQEYPESDRNFASRIGMTRPDLQQASLWISANTPESAVFATNDFCGDISKSCNAETNWNELLDFSMKCSQYVVLRTDKCNAGGYQMLTAAVHRRFLAGNYYVGISDGSAIKPWVVTRVLNSVNFAIAPSNDAVTKLKDSNVGWYLLRRELTTTKDWRQFGTVRYSNSSYIIISFD